MEEDKKSSRSFELRSEKVRNIVGQMPPALVRYGISIIGFVLLCLFVVICFLPYKQIYTGTATVYGVRGSNSVDSINTIIYLKFDGNRLYESGEDLINLYSSTKMLSGCLLQISSNRDTLDRQKSLCFFKTDEIKAIENQTVDFQIVQMRGSIFYKLFTEVEY